MTNADIPPLFSQNQNLDKTKRSQAKKLWAHRQMQVKLGYCLLKIPPKAEKKTWFHAMPSESERKLRVPLTGTFLVAPFSGVCKKKLRFMNYFVLTERFHFALTTKHAKK